MKARENKGIYILRSQSGFALLGVLMIVMAIPTGILLTSELSRVIKDAERTTKSTQTKQAMSMVRDYLISNAKDVDSNGQPDIYADASNSLPIAVPINGVDMFGTAYKYCTWHIGPGNNTNTTYSTNNTVPPKTGLIGKLISAGYDKSFQTDCQDVNSGGDDIVYEIFNTSSLTANSGWTAVAGKIFATNITDFVAIGTDTPTSKLTIYDGGANSDASQQIRIGLAANQDYTIGRMSASGLMKFSGSEASAGYLFDANGTERLQIVPVSGNIQVGAPGSDTGERLQVSGAIKTTDGTTSGKFGADVIVSGALGVGSTSNHPVVIGAGNVEVIRAGTDGTTTLTKSSSAAAFGAGGHLVLANPAGTESQIQFTHAGVTNGSIRSGNAGNLVINARSGGIYLNTDSAVSPTIYSPTGILQLPAAVGIGVAPGAYSLNVNGTTNTVGSLYVAGALFTDTSRNVYANIVNATMVDSTGGYKIQNTAAVNDTPGAYGQSMTLHVKDNAAIGVGAASTYSGVVTITPWVDDTRGGAFQVAYSQDGNIYQRYGTRSGGWGTWRKNIHSVDIAGTANYIPKYTSTTTLGNSQIYDNGTNVGIGTNSPTQKLDVVGNITTSGDIYWGTGSNWLSGYLNQAVKTTSTPTFAGLTVTGPAYFYSNKGNNTYLQNTTNPSLQAYSNDGGAAYMSFVRTGYSLNMGLDPDNAFRIGGGNSANRLILTTGGNLTVPGTITGSAVYNAVYN